MKSVLFVCTVLLLFFAVPASADSVSFTNQGVLSGSLGSGLMSLGSDLALNGTVFIPGPFGEVTFDLGTFTGSLVTGGSFTDGNFELASGSLVFFQSSLFSGTWSNLGNGLYDLAGTFSTELDGIQYIGHTDQQFTICITNRQFSLTDIRGETALTTATVPEPSTLAFLGTGLVGLAGAARRKLRIA